MLYGLGLPQPQGSVTVTGPLLLIDLFNIIKSSQVAFHAAIASN